VLGVDHDAVARPSGEGIAEVVQSATELTVAIGTMAATGAGPSAVIPALTANFGRG
jgi:hypothetical protein